jgi:hypothetical protein
MVVEEAVQVVTATRSLVKQLVAVVPPNLFLQ